jgi:hypothetical protein
MVDRAVGGIANPVLDLDRPLFGINGIQRVPKPIEDIARDESGEYRPAVHLERRSRPHRGYALVTQWRHRV